MDMYFRQFWRDPRLSFERRPGLDKLVVGADYAKQGRDSIAVDLSLRIYIISKQTVNNQ